VRQGRGEGEKSRKKSEKIEKKKSSQNHFPEVPGWFPEGVSRVLSSFKPPGEPVDHGEPPLWEPKKLKKVEKNHEKKTFSKSLPKHVWTLF
jgi:hypothetical protein